MWTTLWLSTCYGCMYTLTVIHMCICMYAYACHQDTHAHAQWHGIWRVHARTDTRMRARTHACIHMFTCARNTKQRYTPHRETQTQMDRQTQYTCTQHHMVIPVNGSMVNNDPSEVEAKCNTSTQDIKNKTESHSNIYYDNVIVRLYVQTRLS